jgi:hypothetical protein
MSFSIDTSAKLTFQCNPKCWRNHLYNSYLYAITFADGTGTSEHLTASLTEKEVTGERDILKMFTHNVLYIPKVLGTMLASGLSTNFFTKTHEN